MYLFDTDVVSNIIKPAPAPNLLARIGAVPFDQQFTSAITVGEMVYGAHKSARPDYFLRQLEERLWPNIRVLAFERIAGEIYGRVRAELERAGMPLAEADLRIAAIALAHDLTLVTGNLRHFSRVPGLRVESWL